VGWNGHTRPVVPDSTQSGEKWDYAILYSNTVLGLG